MRSNTAASRSTSPRLVDVPLTTRTPLLAARHALHDGPQFEHERVLRLLDPMDAVGRHHQAVIDGVGARHRTAFVAAQPDRQQPSPRRLVEGPQHVHRVAARREPDRDVTGSGVSDDLAGEDQLEADVVGERGEHRTIVDERHRGQAPTRAADCGTARRSPSASVALPPLPNVNSRPPCSKRCAIASPAASERGGALRASVTVRRFAALGHLRPGRRGEVGQERAGVALVSVDERVEEAGRFGGHDPCSCEHREGDAGVDEDEVAGPHRVDEADVDRSRASRPRPRRRSRRRARSRPPPSGPRRST